MQFETINKYYIEEDCYNCISKIIDIQENKIYLDETIFYAESGGQESDTGTITFNDLVLNVNNVQYEKKDSIYRTAHYIDDCDEDYLLKSLKVGDKVELKIHKERRSKLSSYHTASHLMFIAAGLVRKGITENTIGCHIKEDSARFDFRVESKFSEEELETIRHIINKMIADDLPIKTYFKDINTNQRVWECDGYEIPCGGTHLSKTSLLNKMNVKRKGIGKGKDRIICYSDSKEI